jgi:hypothetical protein
LQTPFIGINQSLEMMMRQRGASSGFLFCPPGFALQSPILHLPHTVYMHAGFHTPQGMPIASSGASSEGGQVDEAGLSSDSQTPDSEQYWANDVQPPVGDFHFPPLPDSTLTMG